MVHVGHGGWYAPRVLLARRLGPVVVLVALVAVACQKGSDDPAAPCASDSDCALTSRGDDCCDGCQKRAITRTASAALDDRCRDAVHRCPVLDCPSTSVEAFCASGRCRTR